LMPSIRCSLSALRMALILMPLSRESASTVMYTPLSGCLIGLVLVVASVSCTGDS
jgi:hypothetical protein